MPHRPAVVPNQPPSAPDLGRPNPSSAAPAALSLRPTTPLSPSRRPEGRKRPWRRSEERAVTSHCPAAVPNLPRQPRTLGVQTPAPTPQPRSPCVPQCCHRRRAIPKGGDARGAARGSAPPVIVPNLPPPAPDLGRPNPSSEAQAVLSLRPVTPPSLLRCPEGRGRPWRRPGERVAASHSPATPPPPSRRSGGRGRPL